MSLLLSVSLIASAAPVPSPPQHPIVVTGQRIQSAKITSEIEGRKVRDGEIVTACQAVCPTEAIVFGDINDPNSRVSKLKAEQRNYSLLAELNVVPRTTYLSALRNPNPEIK